MKNIIDKVVFYMEAAKVLPRLIDVKGLCSYFDISEKTAYILVRKRGFPSLKIGGKYRVMLDELPKWLEKESRKEA